MLNRKRQPLKEGGVNILHDLCYVCLGFLVLRLFGSSACFARLGSWRGFVALVISISLMFVCVLAVSLSDAS